MFERTERITLRLILGSLCLSTLVACSPDEPQGKTDTKPGAMTGTAVLVAGVDLSHIDKNVRPQDDFYRHLNGSWLDTFDIPADKSNYTAFTRLADKSRSDVKAIIEEASSPGMNRGAEAQKIGDLYQSFMNADKLEQLGVQAIGSEVNRIDKLKNHVDVAAYMAYADIITSAPFGVYVGVDAKNSSRYIVHLWQSGLGLPNRDYYLDKDEKSLTTRAEYIKHISRMFELAGFKMPSQSADTVLKLETAMAAKHRTKEENRDANKRYNLKTLSEVKALAPNFAWDEWLQNSRMTAEGVAEVVVGQPEYIQALNDLVANTSVEEWKTYFKWHLLKNSASLLNAALDQEKFNFYEAYLNGVKEQKPRWERAVRVVNSLAGDLVGKVYVEKHFKSEAKARMSVLVENLRKAYAQSIRELEWMGEDTKQKALDKLAKFTPKIGYPDKWKDYSGLTTNPEDLLGNVKRATLFAVDYQRGKLGKPIDKTEWHMNPQTVNAYYNPTMNEIVFPAAILQPPFFNMDAEDAVNYGGIGAVIGHEMGHGFDDQGSKYDGNGNLNNWWTDTDRKEFEKRTGKLVEQYSSFVVLDNVNINGEYTQGENIGDLGGLTIAYKAYQLSQNGQKGPVIDGLAAEQRMFYGWAQVWRSKYRDEYLLKRIKTDPHSPAEFRTNGVLRNMPEFFEAFGVKTGDKMFLPAETRVKIW